MVFIAKKICPYIICKMSGSEDYEDDEFEVAEDNEVEVLKRALQEANREIEELRSANLRRCWVIEMGMEM